MSRAASVARVLPRASAPMSLYAIGDIQGCHAEFCQLLELIGFSPRDRPAVARRRSRQSRTRLARRAARGQGARRRRRDGPRQSRLPPADGRRRTSARAPAGHDRPDPRRAGSRRADRVAVRATPGRDRGRAVDGARGPSAAMDARHRAACSRARSSRCCEASVPDEFLSCLYGDEPRDVARRSRGLRPAARRRQRVHADCASAPPTARWISGRSAGRTARRTATFRGSRIRSARRPA